MGQNLPSLERRAQLTDLLIVTLPTPHINELGRSILQGSRLVDLELHLLNRLDRGRHLLPQHGRRGRAKVAQLVGLRRAEEDVLDLEISVDERRVLVVHVGDGLQRGARSALIEAGE